MVRCGSIEAAVLAGARPRGGCVGLRHGQVEESLAGPQRQGRCRRGGVVAGVGFRCCWRRRTRSTRPGLTLRRDRPRHRSCQDDHPKRPCPFRRDALPMISTAVWLRRRFGAKLRTGAVGPLWMRRVHGAGRVGERGRVVGAGSGFHGLLFLVSVLGGSGPGSAVGYQAVFVGEDDRLDPVAESEFGEHRGDVGLYGGFADEEGGGDLGVGPALAQ